MHTPTPPTLETIFKGPGFGFTFLYYFALTALIVAIAAMQILHESPTAPIIYQVGLAFALPFALINALQKQTQRLEIAINAPAPFLQRLNQALQELGYDPVQPLHPEEPLQPEAMGDAPQTWVAQRSGWQTPLAGKIYVATTDHRAVLVSRKSVMQQLSAKL
ncbi:hypothetical protein [Lyngbya confervoides]|uniref:Uncharacterized protein n=1 Tax=Lyngbya confervoides BDU141951 TaxID=1574623 RepID=A0ABD4T2M1_9CYAN|nr:hypothetical protein [Lyngbya confervoides]MCM1982982.1 hypothetical protein [Lyngbya confervoides BDU141951]